MSDETLKMILTYYPQPVARCLDAFLKETEPARKYKKLLNLFNTSLRFLSNLSLLNYFYYAVNNTQINTLISDCLHRSEEYHWDRYLIEIMEILQDVSDDCFMPELVIFCQQHGQQWSEMVSTVRAFRELLKPIGPDLECDKQRFTQLLEQYAPRLMLFLERFSFLKNYTLTQYRGQADQAGVFQLTLFQGLSARSVNQKIVDWTEFNIEHLFLFDQNHKKLLDLFPFITKWRCDHCPDDHYFFYNGLPDLNTVQYCDFEANHTMLVRRADVLIELGSLHLKKNLFLRSKDFFEHARELDPASEVAASKLLLCHEKLGNLYYQKENYYRALKHYEDALSVEPDNIRILFNLGLVNKKLKEYDRAIDIFNRLIKRNPNYQRAYELLGYLYEERGNYSKALFYYNRFLKSEPNHSHVLECRRAIMKKIEHDLKTEKEQSKPGQSGERPMTFEEMVTDVTREIMDLPVKPLIGRDQEIAELCQILCCLKKNNPLIIGEVGVGKTAIVEELARRIINGDVPVRLLNRRILQLRAATLLAGTKFRGQFEERLLLLINELKQRKDCILFIDDMHTIMHAGQTKGSSFDVSNALKPELARGDLQVIGISTFDEFRLYLEKDPAFERRFQLVRVHEPDLDICLQIVRSFKEQFELFHQVIIDDAAFLAAVELPRIYLRDRHLPDKAIDLLDRACSMVAIDKATIPEDTLPPMPIVMEEDVVKTVSLLTHIPIAKIMHAHSQRFLSMEEELKKRIIGQDEAISVVSEVIRTTKMEFDIHPQRPDGVFLFVGPTGVGKTELARVMAQFLFGDEEKMLRIDMSEFTDDISTSKLIGITPGYVGYNDRNQLTDHVRNYPYSLILLDEVEKANRQVLNLFLQVFDSGRLTDGRGRTAYFNNTTFVMTSNIGADLFSKSKVGYGPTVQTQTDLVFHSNVSRAELKKAVESNFPPEFINRIDEIVYFRALSKQDVRTIAELHLTVIRNKLARQGKTLVLTNEALDFIVEHGYSEQFGARNLARVIRRFLLDPLALRSLQPEWEKTATIEVFALDEALKIE
ncbi:AAA family ATPase [bacterium]|nr:AAA family ATPase [bacterium]